MEWGADCWEGDRWAGVGGYWVGSVVLWIWGRGVGGITDPRLQA